MRFHTQIDGEDLGNGDSVTKIFIEWERGKETLDEFLEVNRHKLTSENARLVPGGIELIIRKKSPDNKPQEKNKLVDRKGKIV